MDLAEIRPEVTNWIYLVQVRCKWQTLVNMIMNVWVPYKAGSFLFKRSVSFQRLVITSHYINFRAVR
jgi:hypothetical protein